MPRPMRLNSLASCRFSSAAIAALTADRRLQQRSEAAQASYPSSYHNPAAAHPTRKDSPRVTFRAMRRRGHVASTRLGSLPAHGADGALLPFARPNAERSSLQTSQFDAERNSTVLDSAPRLSEYLGK